MYDKMCLLIIHNADAISASRNSKIYLDDKKIGEIFSGVTKTFDIPRGNHTFQVKNRLFGNQKIEINMDKEYHVSIKESLFHFLIVPISIIVMLINMIIAEPLGWTYGIYAVYTFVLMVVYILVFKRNRFFMVNID